MDRTTIVLDSDDDEVTQASDALKQTAGELAKAQAVATKAAKTNKELQDRVKMQSAQLAATLAAQQSAGNTDPQKIGRTSRTRML